jgi:oligopeptide transport system ATP-binding protein
MVESKEEATKKTLELFEAVRIKNPTEVINMYPHQLSGGMVQRIVIVAIIACAPKLIIFDEPTTALDPSIQAEIIEIIRNINKKYKTSIIFITHDLGVVASIADRIGIMYAGRIVEIGLNKEILFDPKHPYT